MAKLLQMGMSTAAELGSRFGHIACTLGGVNYESTPRVIVKGSAARGATNPLFKHHFHLKLTDAQAKKAKAYADKCVGQPYKLGFVPSANGGGDCSGFMSGIIWAAKGKPPPHQRMFTTATFQSRFDDADMGFKKGLGGAVVGPRPECPISPIGRPDRPFPGGAFNTESPKSNHVKWIQARLNFERKCKHPVLNGQKLAEDGEFGLNTKKVVQDFQRRHGLQGLGQVAKKTWKLLNDVR
jgi:peptidoglycan hydrolase-like protein with peptidoglycan-binding domain